MSKYYTNNYSDHGAKTNSGIYLLIKEEPLLNCDGELVKNRYFVKVGMSRTNLSGRPETQSYPPSYTTYILKTGYPSPSKKYTEFIAIREKMRILETIDPESIEIQYHNALHKIGRLAYGYEWFEVREKDYKKISEKGLSYIQTFIEEDW